MIVTVDKNSGFCWGVVRAVNFAEAELAGQSGNGRAPRLYSLGDIIHNPVEVDRLRSEGLETITHADFERIAEENRALGIESKILIRAHGEPPSTFARMEELGFGNGRCHLSCRGESAGTHL